MKQSKLNRLRALLSEVNSHEEDSHILNLTTTFAGKIFGGDDPSANLNCTNNDCSNNGCQDGTNTGCSNSGCDPNVSNTSCTNTGCVHNGHC